MIIWKFAIPPSGELSMPEGAQILSVGEEAGIPSLYTLIDLDENEVQLRHFQVIPTGEEFDPSGLTYIASYRTAGDWRSFHVFEASRLVEAARTVPVCTTDELPGPILTEKTVMVRDGQVDWFEGE